MYLGQLRKSTARTVRSPQFIGLDGLTEKTALTTQSGKITKNGTSSSFTAASWSHDANGYYLIGLSTTHTDTVGKGTIQISDSATYLSVTLEFEVLDAAVWDVLYGTTAPSTHTAAAAAALVLATPANLLATDASGRVQVQVGTSAGQINSSSGKVPATLASTDVTGNVAADLQTIKTQTVTCSGGVTIPAATLASTTNITGGTITTVTTTTTATNLTNAPTAGDFTATMKTSLNSATPAVTVSDKTGFALTAAYDAAKTAAQAGDVMKISSGTGANQISLSSGTVTVGTNSDKTGYSLTQTFPANFAALGINASGHVSRVTLVDTTTTNTDMRGTDSAYTGTPPTAGAISTQVASDLATAHGAGSWATATGFSTHSAADVWAVATRVLTAGTNLSIPAASAIADAVWDEVQSGHTTTGTFGEYLDAQVSTISGGGGGGGDATAANQTTIINAIAALNDISAIDILDQTTAGHTTAGTVGGALASASSAGDPWATDNDGSYAAGTYGADLHDYLADPVVNVTEIGGDPVNLRYQGRLASGGTGGASLESGTTFESNILVGWSILFDGGAGADQRATIASNSAADPPAVTFTAPLATAVDSTTSYSIEQPPDKAGYALASTGLDLIVPAEPTGPPTWGVSTFVQWFAWLGILGRNKQTRTATTAAVRNDADSANVATATVSDDATTFTRSRWS